MRLLLSIFSVLIFLLGEPHHGFANAFGFASSSTNVFGRSFRPRLSSSAAASATTTTTTTTTTRLHAQDDGGSQITMPALSSTMKEGKVVSWLKQEGDSIEAGEAIMVVESDKADMDVEAFEDGFLAKIIIQEGEMAPVGQAVALMASEASEIDAVVANFGNNNNNNGGGTANGADAATTTTAGAAAMATSGETSTAPPDCEFSQIDMPALSSTMKEGKVVSWLKAEGDPISAGEAIMVVESDKADMDVEAFEDGYLAAIIVQEGESGAVGTPVALIAQEQGDISTLQVYAATLSSLGAPPAAAAVTTSSSSTLQGGNAAATPPPPSTTTNNAVASTPGDRVVASPLARKKADELGVAIGSVSGSGPGGRITASDVETAAAASSGGGNIGGGGGGVSKATALSATKPSWTPAAGVIAATPMARQLAKKAKLDLASLVGTGQFGRVTADDVKIATGEQEPVARQQKKKAAAAAGREVVDLPEGLVPMTGMQKAVMKNMVATLTIPEFRVSRDIIMDAFDAAYAKLKPQGVTVSAMIAKAVALAIEKHPIVNSAYSDQNGGSIEFKKDINIAMAVAIDGGLITPTLMYANERGVVELGENWKELVGKAKSNTLSPKEYQSGTFTISNMGMFGVTNFGAILPQGQGGILAIGGTQEMIVPDAQAVLGMKRVKKMTLTLTCDHRQIYGADAALFLKTLADIMENQLDRVVM